MAYLLDIATAVPEFTVSKEELVEFMQQGIRINGFKFN